MLEDWRVAAATEPPEIGSVCKTDICWMTCESVTKSRDSEVRLPGSVVIPRQLWNVTLWNGFRFYAVFVRHVY